MLPRSARGNRPPLMGRVHGAKALDEHYSADGAEKGDVGQGDHKVELAYLAQQLDELHADDRAANAAEQQHCTQAKINIVSAPFASEPDTEEATI